MRSIRRRGRPTLPNSPRHKQVRRLRLLPVADIGSVLSTTYAGLPLYLWLIIGGGGFFLLSKRGR